MAIHHRRRGADLGIDLVVALTLCIVVARIGLEGSATLAGAVIAWIYKREMGVTTAPVSRV